MDKTVAEEIAASISAGLGAQFQLMRLLIAHEVLPAAELAETFQKFAENATYDAQVAVGARLQAALSGDQIPDEWKN